jgi:hypothetical protein
MTDAASIDLSGFFSRFSFNEHIKLAKTILSVDDCLEKGANLADLLNGKTFAALKKGIQTPDTLLFPILFKLLLEEKRRYSVRSRNINAVYINDGSVRPLFNGIPSPNLLFLCHNHIDGSVTAVNPRRTEGLSRICGLPAWSLVVAYASNSAADALAALDALEAAPRCGTPPRGTAHAGGVTPEPRLEKTYSVTVTNDLFHNKNVEAWKNILTAYAVSHPGAVVRIYYNGDEIKDILSLFTWGKIKSGATLRFSVSGQNRKHVARLRDALQEAAGPGFGVFLTLPPSELIALLSS